MSTSTPAPGDRRRLLFPASLLAAGALAAVVGAYVDWQWWPVYSGLMLTLIAVPMLVVGAIVALVARGIVRRGALIVVAVGIGLLVGQNLGPSREPLLLTEGGSMTLRLESPVAAVATGSASCSNVASGTEFQVTGTPDLRLDELNRVWNGVYLTTGDRWDAIDEAPQKDGVRLSIQGNDLRIPDDGFPSMVVMEATEASTLEATFSNDGGSARFAGLAPEVGPELGAAPMDLAGTIEWTCGDAFVE
jgi:hypothetical protein